MNRCYVPIVKCKKGEQTALSKLDESIKNIVVPLFEIPHSAANAKKGAVNDLIDPIWPNRKYLFYFMPEWYDSDLENYSQFVRSSIVPFSNSGLGIPVIDLSNVDSIDCWSSLLKNGVAIRLRNNEFGAIEETLNPLFENTELSRHNVDLVLDLQHVSEDDLFAKTALLKAVFADLDRASEFRSVIIASVSYPNQLPPMESKRIYRFRRTEPEIFARAKGLANRFGFNYVYSDYGPTDIADISFVVGMVPNFKIKYTAFEDYIYIKGISIKKGGLDISNVRELSKTLVDSGDFSGASYSMNHHITFIANQI